MAELTGGDAAPTPSAAVPTSSTPRATTATAAATAPATTEKVRIAVRSATARPPANGERHAIAPRIDLLDVEPLELPGGPPLSDTIDDVRADRL